MNDKHMNPDEIRAFRHRLGLTAEEMARAVGVADGRLIRRWEAGDREPHGSFFVLFHLATEVAGVDNWLIGRSRNNGGVSND